CARDLDKSGWYNWYFVLW
nr:immunoglobulin heavy chain junction region [Macaca mulatta]